MSSRPPGYYGPDDYGPDSFGGSDFDDFQHSPSPAGEPVSSSITVTETHTHVCVRCGFFGTPPAPDAWEDHGFFSTERHRDAASAGPFLWRKIADSIFHTTNNDPYEGIDLGQPVAGACGPVVPIALTEDLRELALDSLEALVRGACVRALGAERGPAAVDLYTRVVQLRRAPAGFLSTSSWSPAHLLTGNNTVRQWITALTPPVKMTPVVDTTVVDTTPVPPEEAGPPEQAEPCCGEWATGSGMHNEGCPHAEEGAFTLVRVSTPRADNGGGYTRRRRLAHLVYAQQLEQLSQAESIETRCGYRLSTWRRASDGHAAGYPLCERCQRANATGLTP